MKKLILTAALLAAAASVSLGQNVRQALSDAAKAISETPQEQPEQVKVSHWTKSMELNLGFNHTGLWSWAAGGYNTATLIAGIDGKANYKKDFTSWDNRLQLDYGFLWSADKENLLQKSKDRIYFESKLGYQTGKDSKWKYSASFDFRSQFTDDYTNYVKDADGMWSGTLKSGFMSPAYVNLALGMDWNPAPWFNMNISPVTAGLVAVLNESTQPNLRKNYGMEQNEDGSWDYIRFLFGAQVKSTAKWTINDVFNFETQLVLFTDYLNEPYLRVNCDNKISWQLAKFVKLSLSTWLIHDPIVMITDPSDIAKYPDGRARVQFKENFAFSFTYTFGKK